MQETKPQKGRCKTLIQNRNKRLLYRFYYFSTIVGLKFSKCLDLIGNEFDLSESRISDILATESDTLTYLERQNIDIPHLKKEYPFYNWHYNGLN